MKFCRIFGTTRPATRAPFRMLLAIVLFLFSLGSANSAVGLTAVIVNSLFVAAASEVGKATGAELMNAFRKKINGWFDVNARGGRLEGGTLKNLDGEERRIWQLNTNELSEAEISLIRQYLSTADYGRSQFITIGGDTNTITYGSPTQRNCIGCNVVQGDGNKTNTTIENSLIGK